MKLYRNVAILFVLLLPLILFFSYYYYFPLIFPNLYIKYPWFSRPTLAAIIHTNKINYYIDHSDFAIVILDKCIDSYENAIRNEMNEIIENNHNSDDERYKLLQTILYDKISIKYFVKSIKTFADQPKPPEPEWIKGSGIDNYGPWIDILIKKSKCRMRWIPPGEQNKEIQIFNGNKLIKTEKNTYTSKGFWIGETEVTREFWLNIMDFNFSQYSDEEVGQDFPIDVSFDHCLVFIEKINKLIPKFHAYLPSKEQWEFAVLAKNFEGKNIENFIDSFAWYGEKDRNLPHKVRQKKSTNTGLFDVQGNLSEWCSEKFDFFYDDLSFTPKIICNPYISRLKDKNPLRIIKGGDFKSSIKQCNVLENYYSDRSSGYLIGFRFCISLWE